MDDNDKAETMRPGTALQVGALDRRELIRRAEEFSHES